MANDKKQLSARDLSAAMRSAICDMAYGTKLHFGGATAWLSKGFESVLDHRTFRGLMLRGLVIPTPANRNIWKLTGKGKRWAALPWKP